MNDGGVTRRGRPPATSRAHVARVALQMFVEHGYEATTMQDVAAAVGLTRRSLFRYFDSKAAIVWHGAEEAAQAALHELRALPDGTAWRTGVAHAVLAALRIPGDDLQALRLRLQLIGQVPDLQAHLVSTGRETATALTAYITARTGADAGELEPVVVSHAVWAACSTGLLWWAAAPPEAGTARDAVRRSLAALGFEA